MPARCLRYIKRHLGTRTEFTRTWYDRWFARVADMHAFDAPLVARFFAIEELRAAGWKHRPESAASGTDAPRPTHGKEASGKRDRRDSRDDAERMWSGAAPHPARVRCSDTRRRQ